MSLSAPFRPPPAARWVVGAGLLALLAYLVDVRSVADQLARLDSRWVALALLVTVGQTVLSAWRWRYTADRLGLELTLPEAVSEYYRGVFLNQILPGGVIGDASRAWRHASRAREEWGGAVRSVILERVSGQVVMAAFAAGSVAVLASRWTAGGWGLRASAGALAVMVMLGVARYISRRARPGTAVGTFVADARRALFARDVVAVQVTTSSLIVGSYVLTYLMAARAVGIDTPLVELAPLVPPVLLAMLVPLSVAGWGLREGAAAGLWAAAGLGAEAGVAISVAYGLVVLLGTLPGAYLLALGGLASGDPPSVAPDVPAASSSRSKRTSSPSTK